MCVQLQNDNYGALLAQQRQSFFFCADIRLHEVSLPLNTLLPLNICRCERKSLFMKSVVASALFMVLILGCEDKESSARNEDENAYLYQSFVQDERPCHCLIRYCLDAL